MVDTQLLKNKEQKISKIYTIIKISTIVLILFAVCFVNYILSNEFASAEKYMEQGVLQTASNFKGRLTNSTNEMKILSAELTSYTNSFSKKDITDFLLNNIQTRHYDKLIFVYKNGTSITAEYNKPILYDETNYDEIKKSINILGNIKKHETGYINEITVPVYDKENKIKGALISQSDAEIYLNILSLNNYEERGNSYIINSEGDFIIKPKRDTTDFKNFFEDKINFIATSQNQVKEQLKVNKTGNFLLKYKNKKFIATYAKIDKTGKYVLTVVPFYVLMLHVDKLIAGVIIIVILISLLSLALSFISNKLFKQNENIIYNMAFLDNITGAGNRNKFLLEARKIIDNNSEASYAVISIDITKFKAINELYGFERANDILKDIYTLIKNNITEGSICVRDYAATYIVLYKYEDINNIKTEFIDKVLNDLSLYNKKSMKEMSYDFESLKTAKLALSFGVYIISDTNISIDIMCERAYIAKRSIKDDIINVYKFYDESIRAKILMDKEIEDEMYPALNDKQFKMYLQPKFYLGTKNLAGAEALVRWIHPTKGLIPPMNFIPLFEQNGFVIELDRCVWAQACSYLSERKKKGLELFHISVNVSRLHMNNDAFISELVALTQQYDIEPKYLELELTETACFNNENRFKEIINKLKLLGFTISMDDFGTGYSSLNMLRHLPVDVLKLDRGFIKDTLNEKRGQIVVESIIDLANKLNMITVAEGIEFEEQAEYLKNAGCQIAQGFLYGKPMDIESFSAAYLSDNQAANTNYGA